MLSSNTPAVRISTGLCTLPLVALRLDGPTQHRPLNERIISEYAALMRQGVEFPPVRAWYDGTNYWLSDGYHRVAAAQRVAFADIGAELQLGSETDAEWDSFSANGHHGLRWTKSELRQVIELTLSHPNSAILSNIEIARHLHVSEKTVRRIRCKSHLSNADSPIRMVKRGHSVYPLATANIGSASRRLQTKSRNDLRLQLTEMKRQAKPTVRRVLVIVSNWALGSATAQECLDALQRVMAE